MSKDENNLKRVYKVLNEDANNIRKSLVRLSIHVSQPDKYHLSKEDVERLNEVIQTMRETVTTMDGIFELALADAELN